MPAPSNIVLTPNSCEVGTEVTLTATDLFEREFASSTEFYTSPQDFPGGTVGVDGLLGKAIEFEVNTEGYPLGNWVTSDFFGNGFLFSTFITLRPTFDTSVNSLVFSRSDVSGLESDNVNIMFQATSQYIRIFGRIKATSESATKYRFFEYKEKPIADMIDKPFRLSFYWDGNPLNNVRLFIDTDECLSESDYGLPFNGNISAVGVSSTKCAIGVRYRGITPDSPIRKAVINDTRMMYGTDLDGINLTETIAKLSNIPTIFQDAVDVTPSRFESETSCKFTVV